MFPKEIPGERELGLASLKAPEGFLDLEGVDHNLVNGGEQHGRCPPLSVKSADPLLFVVSEHLVHLLVLLQPEVAKKDDRHEKGLLL